jgi:hypothetical protein
MVGHSCELIARQSGAPGLVAFLMPAQNAAQKPGKASPRSSLAMWSACNSLVTHRDVVRRVRPTDVRETPVHHPRHVLGPGRVSAEEAVVAGHDQVPCLDAAILDRLGNFVRVAAERAGSEVGAHDRTGASSPQGVGRRAVTNTPAAGGGFRQARLRRRNRCAGLSGPFVFNRQNRELLLRLISPAANPYQAASRGIEFLLPFQRRAVPFLLILSTCLLTARHALAIPAFARKYGTSCLTCHTVYPKLTPFGEAFRRNGYHFPGVDSDYAKQEVVPLGQDAQKTLFPKAAWPGTLPASVPIAVGFNGNALLHPDTHATGALADNGTAFSLRDLVAEGHIWAGGSYDDHFSFWSEFTFHDTASVEKAKVIISDFIGPPHAVNVVVGRDQPTITSFGSHSSYVADAMLFYVPTTAIFGGASESFSIGSNYNGVELNGVLGGRMDYSIGLNAGANVDLRPTESFYGHVGYKVGGMRLDGEGGGPADPARPWAETALTVDAFAYRSNSRFTTSAALPQQDPSTTLGLGLRGQVGALELNSGVYTEDHRHAQADGTGARVNAQYNELSYVVFPWLVPAMRVEYLQLRPEGGDLAYDLRVIPGAAVLLRPNLKLVVAGQLEKASLAPPGGWGPSGGLAAPTTGVTPVEIESVTIGFFTTF